MTRLFAIGIAFLTVAIPGGPGTYAAGAAPTLQTHPCQLANLARAARCGVLPVPEDPEHPRGRALSIHVAIVTASSGKSLSDPIVVLMGGPGEEAIAEAADYAEEFKALLDDRDLLLVDQRLTGQSAPARCHLYSSEVPAENLHDFFPPAAVELCKRLLEPLADLSHYTFPYFSRDLEQVRVALGYGSLNLFSGSYGTRAAQAFIRQYPKSVRTVYLGSPVPIDAGGPLDFAKTSQIAFGHTLDNCERDTACHGAFPNIRKEFASIMERLDAGQVRVQSPGSKESVQLTRGRVVEWMRSALYRPRTAATLPWVIHHAFEGDWSPIVDGMLASLRGADKELSWGLFFSITCNEDMPFLAEQDIDSETKGTYLGAYRIRQQQAACKDWPKAKLPEGYRNPVHSDAPTLIVTGDLDGGTPLWFADRVAPGFSRHVTVVTHGQGHTEWNNCVAGLFERLVRSGSIDGLDGNSCPEIPIPPFKT